jgi:heme-degrading monooxygenase HmoA
MRHLFLFAAISLCAACSGSDDKKNAETPTPSPGDVEDGCARGALESDLGLTPMSGPMVSGEGTLMAPGNEGYVVSSTFLRLKDGETSNKRFQELFTPILAGFAARPGMLAFQLGLSASCNTARTLSVWSSSEAMYEFVTSDEHMAAVNAVDEVSRGGSVVVHWDAATLEESSWAEGARKLAASTGPFY